MYTTRIYIGLMLLTSYPANSSGGEPARLAANGKALMPIVIANGASDEIKSVADELSQYLKRITGARFVVQTGNGKTGIVLGTMTQFPTPKLQKSLRIVNGFDGVEAFAVSTSPKRVLLLGATDRGVSHAAYRFLEVIGCRWFFPADEWEVVPSIANLTVQHEETDRPALLSRRIWYGYGFFDRREGKCQRDYQAWAKRNRMSSSHSIHCGHAWQSIILSNKKLFDEHPEHLALVKGERRGPQFCVSNPAVRKLAADWALDQLRRRPQLDMVSMETSDGSNHCECAECRKMGSISDRVFGLANEVARKVAKQAPGKMVGMLAYNDHCEPPSFPLEPNVYVQSTAGFIRGKYTFEELMHKWPNDCKRMGFYEYFSVWLWDFDRIPGGRGGNVPYIAKRIREYVSLGATSLDCESGNNWGVHGRGYYVANKLMWNPKSDVDALLADFYEKAFGPAADVMKRYYERLDPGNEPLVSEHLLALALRDLQEATKLAKNRPDVLARLRHLKHYQHYVRLRWEHDRAIDASEKKEYALAALTHAYRTRYSYMNHWAAMFYGWTPRAAKEFGDPSWAFNSKAGNQPWKVNRPYTHIEIEKNFASDLQRFQPQPIAEVRFSNSLAPAGLTTLKPAVSFQRYQKSAKYGLYSPDGKPLKFTIRTGIIAWYRDRPQGRYTLTNESGKQVAEGKLPQDGKDHELKIKVPAKGVYWMTFTDQAAGWGMQVDAGRPVVLALERSTHPLHLGQMQPMYFYVPKGTRKIQYYWKGRPHEIWSPDGKLFAKVNQNGGFVTLDVPAGQDGRPWSLKRLVLGHLWFFNVPNYLAASPDAMLIPRELAAKQP